MYISCSSTYSSDGHQGTRHSSGGVYCILISTLSLSCFVHILQREAEYRLFRQNMGRHTIRTPQDTPLERATADRQSIVTKANNVLSFPSNNFFSLSAIGRRDGVSWRGRRKNGTRREDVKRSDQSSWGEREVDDDIGVAFLARNKNGQLFPFTLLQLGRKVVQTWHFITVITHIPGKSG